VRSRSGDRHRRVVGRVAKRLSFPIPVALPSQHAKTGHAETRERRADEIGNGSEILGDDFGACVAKYVKHMFAKRELLGLRRWRKEAFAIAGARFADGFRARVGPIEPDEMIDPITVVQ